MGASVFKECLAFSQLLLVAWLAPLNRWPAEAVREGTETRTPTRTLAVRLATFQLVTLDARVSSWVASCSVVLRLPIRHSTTKRASKQHDMHDSTRNDLCCLWTRHQCSSRVAQHGSVICHGAV